MGVDYPAQYDEPLLSDHGKLDCKHSEQGHFFRRRPLLMIYAGLATATLFFSIALIGVVFFSPYESFETELSNAERAAQQMINFEIDKLREIEETFLRPKDPLCELVPNEQRFDCLPQGDISQATCEARGCCWKEPSTKSRNRGRKSSPDNLKDTIPYCYYTFDQPSYVLTNFRETDNGFTGLLGRDNASVNAYPNPVPQLSLNVYFESDSRLHVKITDAQNARYEVPIPKLIQPPATKASNPLYEFKVTCQPFSFQVRRRSTGTIVFDTSAGSFSFYDQFLELSSYLPSRYIYGLGEHTDRHFLHSVQWSKFTFWTTDIEPNNNTPLYGVHPFFLSMEEDGNSNGVFLFNSNAMDVILQPAPAITYRTIGGVLDFYIFLGPTPEDVTAQYIEVVGKPALPPYWALGFHLCRWGYKSLDGTKAVTDRNIAAGIPFDAQWNDIDYMISNKDFTVNENFTEIAGFVDHLHSIGMHYVVIVDPGISTVEPANSYYPYDDGIKMDVFVKNATGGVIEGRVWTGKNQAYPDFTHPNATAYWMQTIEKFRKMSPVDGLWIDMDEPSDFVDGSVYGCPSSTLEDPPYLPQIAGKTLRTRTLCMTAKQSWGQHYNLHNLYGITEAIATQAALLEIFPNKRPFIISRSSFAGQGAFSGHWSGDQPADWYHLQTSIADMLSFNMYGVPLMGADICGFGGDTTDELCQRWSQVGAFYPFSRNHNSWGARDQDPASFPEPIVASIRNALLTRYSILSYYNSLFFRASLNGCTVVRPLFFQYPRDLATYPIDEQFLVGSALLVSPVLTPATTSIVAYFPDDRWYDFYIGKELMSEGEWVHLDAPPEVINVHLRGGSIIPTQKPEVTTTATRKNPFELLIGLDRTGQACGELFWDDGEQFDVLREGDYAHVEFALQNGTLSSKVVQNGYADVPDIDKVTIFGMTKPTEVSLNSNPVEFAYDNVNMVLTISSLKINTLEPFAMTFSSSL